jgi:MFS transporter, putative metabolite:H+ symporter
MVALARMTPDPVASVNIETSRLSRRYLTTVSLLAAQAMFEYFDFYVVGYLVAVLAPTWRLSYGQSSIILLSAGVGSIAGAIVCGWAADRIGCRLPILLGGFVHARRNHRAARRWIDTTSNC